MGAEHYLIGAGRVFFNDGGNAGAAGNGFLDIGNIPKMGITREQTKLEHNVVVGGERLVDKTLVTQQKMGISFVLDEFNSENLNIVMMGNGVTTSNQTGATISEENIVAPAILDRSVFVAETNISSLSLTTDPSGTTYVLDTDYEIVNATTGEIKILSTGSISASEALLISYTSAVRNRKKIIPGKDLQVQGSARIEIDNPINGKAMTWKIQNCQLSVEGENAIDSENWSQATIVLDILVDKDVTTSEPYGALYTDA